ncbi:MULTISPECIES: hypothetical protein [Achromobacter]|uniref:Uncharacterized protein n=1 Tax=Achromobacter xylosoxidans (strain A8) TaxID=762376 RepID=E3HYE6_ACHXA|nr:hypothetical protein [Achromobacter xylosoxidans]ADP20100.1 hypothetical protein AXYL_06818 [Achromobacter xylosoxidans A8]
MTTPQNRLWRVVLPWEQDDEGHFDTDVYAPTPESACLAAAAIMLDHDEHSGLESQAERDAWIKGRADEAVCVVDVRENALQDLRALFAHELGIGADCANAETICWEALRSVIRLHRSHLLTGRQEVQARQAYRVTRMADDGPRVHMDALRTLPMAVIEARAQGAPYEVQIL